MLAYNTQYCILVCEFAELTACNAIVEPVSNKVDPVHFLIFVIVFYICRNVFKSDSHLNCMCSV